jgi:glycosyltransferase involved in cell wall biosynthesis
VHHWRASGVEARIDGDCILGRRKADRGPLRMDNPLVSVVIATYNRSGVLAHAIESVRRSTLADWELIVVGDHCTDDTAAVVAAFADPRITYVDLPANVGEQSGPNNEGVRRARGRYLAFLNHDDLYFPDHLETSLARCQSTGADAVWSPLLVGLPATEAELEAGAAQFRLSGVPLGEAYDPRVFVFASSWLLTRELADRVGPWRPARETFVTSSQDWLHRAWRSGARLRFHPHVGVLALPGGARRDSYAAARSAEHDHFAPRLGEPGFRERALERAAISSERESNRFRFGEPLTSTLRALVLRPANAAAMAVGVHPHAWIYALRHGRRGNLVNHLRRHSGLGRLPPR